MIACVSASKDAIGFPCITTLHRASERPKMHTYTELLAEQQCAAAQREDNKVTVTKASLKNDCFSNQVWLTFHWVLIMLPDLR